MITSMDKDILRLAIPSIVSNVTVPLLGLVDLTIVGHMGNAACIGAIAVGSMIFNVIYWLFGFLRMGTSGMTSQAYGQDDQVSLQRLLVRSMGVALAIGLLFVIFQIPIRALALWTMKPSVEVAPFVITYFNICIWGAPAIFALNSLNGWFIGMQNTRIPMVVSILQNIVNIMASCFFVFVLGMQIEGVALGTLVAQWSGVFLSVYMKGKVYSGRYSLTVFPDGTFDRAEMGRFFKVNRDIFFRTFFLVAVNLFFTAAGSRQGTLIVSVNAMLLTFYTLFSYVMDGFAYAGEALSGKYFGAHDQEGFHQVCRRLAVWGAVMVVAFTIAYGCGGQTFLYLLTSHASVITGAKPYMTWTLLIPVAGVAAFLYDGIFIGATATRGMLWSSAIAAVLFFFLFFLLEGTLHNHALWIALLVYMATRGIVQYFWFRLRLAF